MDLSLAQAQLTRCFDLTINRLMIAQNQFRRSIRPLTLFIALTQHNCHSDGHAALPLSRRAFLSLVIMILAHASLYTILIDSVFIV